MPYSARKAIAAGMAITPYCKGCNDVKPRLDLAAIVAEGRGDLDLYEKPFYCRLCGGRRGGLQGAPVDVPKLV